MDHLNHLHTLVQALHSHDAPPPQLILTHLQSLRDAWLAVLSQQQQQQFSSNTTTTTSNSEDYESKIRIPFHKTCHILLSDILRDYLPIFSATEINESDFAAQFDVINTMLSSSFPALSVLAIIPVQSFSS